jgi:hypothetical protein
MKPGHFTHGAFICMSSQAALLASSTVRAQQATPLAMGGDALGLPGIGKVLLAFVIAATLAFAAGVVLRRLAPKFTGAMFAGGGSLRVLERLQLGSDLRVHLVEVERSKILITAHRNSISVVVLESPAAGSSP